tara:strand:- start:991 stop:2421 length:1431 start_codon:yes stop_codon:yes gene_type:complete
MPTAINNNIATIHKKEWQQMNPLITNGNSGTCMVADPRGVYDYSLMVFSATVQALYSHSQDHYVTIPSMGMAAISGGANGCMARWSGVITANGGTTTTITTVSPINTLCIGRIVRFASGTAGNIGLQRTVTNLIMNPSGTSTITLDSALPSAVANADTFRIDSGMFYVMGAGAIGANLFKSYDPLTGIITALSSTGLPTVSTDSFIINTMSFDVYATGTATAGASATTLPNISKSWAVNQWTNYQIRITSGTGIGQVRTIASNTATVITVSSAWTTNPSTDSVYEITGNDDNIYFSGNATVTLYKFSISANTWATITPTVARAAATNNGCTVVWNYKTGNADWANESTILDGKYLYSYRGGVIATTLDRYDIAANSWAVLTLPGNAEASTVMGPVTSCVINNDTMITRLGTTHRYMAYNICTGISYGLTQNVNVDGGGFTGVRMWLKKYQESGVDKLVWIYSWRSNQIELYRLLLY